MRLSERMKRVPASATVGASAKAEELRRAGRDIISLAAGEPDFDTPEHIRLAAKAAIDSGKTRYTSPAGLIELRQAIQRKLARENSLHYNEVEISTGCGAKQSLMALMMATLDHGDEVIVPTPYWVSHRDIPQICGGTPVLVPCSQANGFKLGPEALEAAITPRTRWLVLCSPSNPTGAVYGEAELSQLAAVLRRHPHVGIVADHIYEHIVYDGLTVQAINAVAPDLHERTVILNGLSKGYCMTGWRVGFIAGPRMIVDAVNALQSQSINSTSTISQWAAVAALDGSIGFMAENNAAFVKRRDFVVAALNAIPGLSCERPQGAFYAYPSCAGAIGKVTPDGNRIGTDMDFAEYLLVHGVSIVAGAAFGLSPHFRISYAASMSMLEEACKRIAQACDRLSQSK